MRPILALIIALCSVSAYAAPVVLTFEDAVVGGSSSNPETIIYRGYTLTTELGFETALNPIGPALFFCSWCSVTVHEENDNPFSLSSFDFFPGGGVGSVILTGFYADGGSITEEFLIRTPNIWGSTVLDNRWTGLEYVVFQSDLNDAFFSGLDNITLTAVPVPAAVWLFGSALAVLGWTRRKQSV